MGIFDKLKGEFIDIIEWTGGGDGVLAYRFDRYQNEIKNGAKLTVREGQVAIFVNEGQVADLFTPGMYELRTENLPLLSTLQGWKHGFNSPFKAEVIFITTTKQTDQKWGTKSPITLDDPRFGFVEIRAFGTYVIRVKDPTSFLSTLVGTDGEFTAEEISGQLKSLIVTRFTDAIGESNLTIEKFASQLNELSEFALNSMAPEFLKYGIELCNILVENVSMPEDIKKEIHELSRLGRINMSQYQQLKAAKAMEKAAENPGGMAGAGVGLGAGLAMANQMGNAFGAAATPHQQQPAANSAPPALPGQAAVAFHVALNGQQAGPYDMNGLKALVQSQQLTRETLVWANGMANWTKAGDVPALATLFTSAPPPLP